uniref:Uncharacterized protein n=1 Tax=Parascaris equorum TaxID=6256 RepID=A0A914S026_PAREQ
MTLTLFLVPRVQPKPPMCKETNSIAKEAKLTAAMLAGSVVRFYDFPLYAWGTIMPNEMTYTAKYPTVVVTIPSSIP